jgi:N utilization substance protein B
VAHRERTRARELALQILYQADLLGDAALDELEPALRKDHPTDIVDYAFDLARGVRAGRAALDAYLARAAKHWAVARMAVVDRNILRMGADEMLRHPGVPPKAVLNEAIELAKRFSTASSGAFVNGVLDRVRKDLEAEGLLGKGPLPAPAPGAAAPAASPEPDAAPEPVPARPPWRDPPPGDGDATPGA